MDIGTIASRLSMLAALGFNAGQVRAMAENRARQRQLWEQCCAAVQQQNASPVMRTVGFVDMPPLEIRDGPRADNVRKCQTDALALCGDLRVMVRGCGRPELVVAVRRLERAWERVSVSLASPLIVMDDDADAIEDASREARDLVDRIVAELEARPLPDAGANAEGTRLPTDDGDGESLRIALTDSNKRVLQFLCDQHPADLFKVTGEGGIVERMWDADSRNSLSERTIRTTLSKLHGVDLVEYPEGKGQGVRASSRGRRLCREIAGTLPS